MIIGYISPEKSQNILPFFATSKAFKQKLFLQHITIYRKVKQYTIDLLLFT